MNAVFLKRVKAAIQSRMETLLEASDATQDDRATVVLDQQSVGRLSRMDALQQQAMAKANDTMRRKELSALTAALQRLETDEYGFCIDCGDEIGEKRLERMPTTLKCMDCMRG